MSKGELGSGVEGWLFGGIRGFAGVGGFGNHARGSCQSLVECNFGIVREVAILGVRKGVGESVLTMQKRESKGSQGSKVVHCEGEESHLCLCELTDERGG